MKPSITAILSLAALQSGLAFADEESLTVYTYDSFTADWGPGPQVEAAFEKQCGCDLNFLSAGDAAAVLSRVLLEGERTEADIVLGLDTNLSETARQSGLFADHGLSPGNLTLPVDWNDSKFLPFDWGYFAFVYDETRLPVPPASLNDLVYGHPDLSVIIQDPRSSSPGLGLLLWVKLVMGEQAKDAWAALAPKIVTVTKGWSEAYGAFLDGESDMVLSYTTSPAYHAMVEDDLTKKAAVFSEGNYMQIETAGKIASTDSPELADMFLKFMLSEEFQSIIPTSNWMYPAALPGDRLPAEFADLPVPETALIYDSETVHAVRKDAVEEWRVALTR